MLDSLTLFINSIAEFSFNIPVSVIITILVIIIIALCVSMYFVREKFETNYLRTAYTWYFIVAIINLLSILAIYYFYNSVSGQYIGPKGKKGKRGKMGKHGTSVSCSYCKGNIYIESTHRSDVICKLSTMTPTTFINSMTTINSNNNYFTDLIENGTIDYSQFVSKIVLSKKGDPSLSTSVSKFKSLMDPFALTYAYIYYFNEIGAKASTDTYGTFKRPIGITGYLPFGSSVYGGIETFNLNSFVVNGDIMYPVDYTLLVSFKSYNQDTDDYDMYTIWRPVGQTINEQKQLTQKNNTTVAVNYIPLGDICVFGTKMPNLNEIATVRESCLEIMPAEYLTLVFLYMGSLNFTDDKQNINFIQSLDYVIENKTPNTVQLFSIWRTPLNTFITNSNEDNIIVNNTVIYNIYNNLGPALNEYGNIKTAAKQLLIILLGAITVPKITVAATLCRHFEIECARELLYYINQSQSTTSSNNNISNNNNNNDNSTPDYNNDETTEIQYESTVNPIDLNANVIVANSIKNIQLTNATTLGDMMKAVEDTIAEYDKYNKNLQSQAVAFSSKYKYNQAAERHIPPDLLKVYNTINIELTTLPIQMENTTTMLDIINVIFPNGLDTRIAVDANGIQEGGILLNEVQELILRICKIFMPPAIPVYNIKDECLGAFPVDKERNDIIRALTEEIVMHNKFLDMRKQDPDKFQPIWAGIMQREHLLNSQIGEFVGHIKNWHKKLKNMDLEEFTTTRLKEIYGLYFAVNIYYTQVYQSL